MEIMDLKIFCDLVDLKSFTRAAQKNFLTQSAVSQRIKKLNDTYDGKLFLNRKKMIISEHGKYIYEKFSDMIKLYESTQEIIQNKTVRDVLTIGFSENSKIQYLSAQFLEKLSENNFLPEIYIGSSRNVFEKIVFGILDYGIVGSRPKETTEIEIHELYRESIVLATGINNKNKNFDIASVPLILDHRDSGLYLFLKHELAANNIDIDKLNIRGYVGTSVDKMDLIIDTEYYSFVARQFVENNPKVFIVETGMNIIRFFYEIFQKRKSSRVNFLRDVISSFNQIA